MTCWGADFGDLLSKGMRSCKELDWLQGLVQRVFKQRQASDSEISRAFMTVAVMLLAC